MAETDATADFPFLRLTEACERMLVDRLELEALSLPPELADRSGTWKGQPARVLTRAHFGPSIRYARFVTVSGSHLQIGNMLCIPNTWHRAPILGADFVCARAETGMVAIDMSPVTSDPHAREQFGCAMERRRKLHDAFPEGGLLPDWCTAWFSDHPLFTRGSVAELHGVGNAVLDLCDLFANCVRTSPRESKELVDDVRLRQMYLQMHREDDKGLNLLAKMFGAQWAAAYLTDVLFPDWL